MKKSERKETPQELGLNFPVVVKTCCGGSSIGVYIVDDQADYTKALDGAFTATKTKLSLKSLSKGAGVYRCCCGRQSISCSTDCAQRRYSMIMRINTNRAL